VRVTRRGYLFETPVHRMILIPNKPAPLFQTLYTIASHHLPCHPKQKPLHTPFTRPLPPPHHPPLLSLSFSSIFLLAFSTISSLLRCKSACRSFLLLLHNGAVTASPSLPADGSPILDARLYLVIRSGCVGLFSGDVERVDAVKGGRTGWNDGGGYETIVSIQTTSLSSF